MKSLEELVSVVEREFGEQIRRPSPAPDLSNCPPPLRDFYGATDGLELPFIEIFPLQMIDTRTIDGWSIFGSDRYFSYCLCSADPGCASPIDLWDHDIGSPPENTFNSVLELLEHAYLELIENDHMPCTVVVIAVHPTVKLASAVRHVKSISGGASSALLQDLKNPPVTYSVDSVAQGVKVVRDLQSIGVDCHVSINT